MITAAATCSEEGCDRPVHSRGFCFRDYQRRKRSGTLPTIQCPVPKCANESNYKQRPCQSHLAEFTSAGVKWCSNPACGNPVKKMEEFHRNRSTEDGFAGWCKACIKNYAAENSDLISTRTSKRRVENPGIKHKLTAGQYWKMWTDQQGRCAICSKQLDHNGASSIKPCVDHDHAHCPGGAGCPECVRSLLCHGCNGMLGHAHDDPAILRRWRPTRARPQYRIDAAIAHLEKWHAEMAKKGIRPSLEDALWQDLCTAMTSYVFAITPA